MKVLSGLLLMVLFQAPLVEPNPERNAESGLIAQIEKLGGKGVIRDGKVIAVDFEGIRIREAHRKLIAECLNIETLNLSRTGLTDDSFKKIALGERLKHLDLSSNHLSDKGLRHISSAKNLLSLNIRQTDAGETDLIYIVECKHLQSLRIDHSKLTDSTIKSLAECKGLIDLDVSFNAVTDAALDTLTLDKLRELSIADTKCERPPLQLLHRNISLTYINMSNIPMNDTHIEALANHKALVHLCVSRTRIVGIGFRKLSGNVPLKILDISSTCLTDEGLAAVTLCSTINSLDIIGTNVSNAAIAHLPKLKSLQTLILGTPNFLDNVPARFSSDCIPSLIDCPALKTLQFEGTPFTKTDLDRLYRAKPKLTIK